MTHFAGFAEAGRRRYHGWRSRAVVGPHQRELRHAAGASTTWRPGRFAQVETARQCGASAKFAGSGGAIVGTYRDAAMLRPI